MIMSKLMDKLIAEIKKPRNARLFATSDLLLSMLFVFSMMIIISLIKVPVHIL
jgi:hypothetical protein